MNFCISFLVFCLTAYWLTAFVKCRIMRKSFRWNGLVDWFVLMIFSSWSTHSSKRKGQGILWLQQFDFVLQVLHFFCLTANLDGRILWRMLTWTHFNGRVLWPVYHDFQIPMMYCMEVHYTSELRIVDWFKVILNRGIDWKSVILGLQNNVLNCKIVRRLCSRLVTDKMYLLAKFVCTCFALMVPHWRTDRMSDYSQAPIVVELCFQAIAMVLDLSNATWYGQFQIFKMGMEW